MEVIPTSLPVNQRVKIVRMNCTEMNQRDMVDYLHDNAALSLSGADVVKGECAVGTYAGEDGGFAEVESHT